MIEYEKYREAGKIAGEALKVGIKSLREGVSYIEIAEKVEDYIKNRAEPAFPVNLSVNSVAAHFTPSIYDENIFRRGDVVKIDVGVHVDGYVGDTAKTVEIGSNRYKKLIESAEKALSEAIEIARDGIKIEELGNAIEKKIKEYGFRPIKNLHGHSLERYKLHAGISIPNFNNRNKMKLKKGQVVAIEPFTTDGEGIVVDGGIGNIYRLNKNSALTKTIRKRFYEFPFSDRWLYEIYGDKTPLKVSFLMKRKLISPYFKLVEIKNGMVAQAEHTVLIHEEGCEILTEV